MKQFTWNDIQTYLNTGIQDSYFSKGTGISVGSFDGLHLGHRTLLSQLVFNCKKNNLIPGVVSFKRPLPSIKHSGDYQGDVSTLEQRLKLFEELGIEFVIIIDFDDSFASILGTDFLNIMVNACNMEFICEGVDFRFGYKGATDVSAIKYFAEQNNIGTCFVNQVIYHEGTDEEERISSSYIRTMILKGFLSTVEELLSRPYSVLLPVNCFEKSENHYRLKKSSIHQILPPAGVYHCNSKSENPVRLEITEDYVVVDYPVEELIF